MYLLVASLQFFVLPSLMEYIRPRSGIVMSGWVRMNSPRFYIL